MANVDLKPAWLSFMLFVFVMSNFVRDAWAITSRMGTVPSFQKQQDLPSFYTATDDDINWSGRVLRNEEYMRVVFDWPGVTASFQVDENATAVTVMVDDSSLVGTRFAVFYDSPTARHRKLREFRTLRGVFSYTLADVGILGAQGLRFEPNVTLSMVHTQEAQFLSNNAAVNNVTVLGFGTDGFLSRPSPSTRRLEFIGDSITAGYGADGLAPCVGSVETNNYVLTWAHALCQSLDAECFVEAYSGVGVYASYPHPGTVEVTMPERFADTLASAHQLKNMTTGGLSPGFHWKVDASTFRPDALIFNLGTNDFCCGRGENSTFVEAYAAAYYQFVSKVLEFYAVPAGTRAKDLPIRPSSPKGPARAGDEPAEAPLGAAPAPVVFLGVGPMSARYQGATRGVVERLTRRGVRAILLDLMLDPTVLMGGCLGHPTGAVHAAVAEKAFPVVEATMGWK